MERTLVLCIDRDNDLYTKAKVNGPIIGRKNNLDAATKLALADPQDVDANTMFYAVKLYDSLSKSKKKVEVVTLTGHKNLGYKADREISNQLDRVIREFGSTNCVLVTDGASDEEVIPIIKSRMKINSTKIVYVKQSKELEKTYYVILEKLRDPYYARIILGIPALILLLLSAASYSGVGWQPVGIVVGLYILIFKGFGYEDQILGFFKNLNFSFDRVSWIANVLAFIIGFLAIIVATNAYSTALRLDLEIIKLSAYVLSSMIPLLVMSIILIITGKVIDAVLDKRAFVTSRYALYAVSTILLALIIDSGSNWIVNIREPFVSFGDFFFIMLASLLVAGVSIMVINFIKTSSLLNMKLEGKEVINTNGSLIGRIIGVNANHGVIILQNVFGKKIQIPFDSIFSVAEKVIIKSLV